MLAERVSSLGNCLSHLDLWQICVYMHTHIHTVQVSDDGRTLFSVPNEVGEGGGVLAGSCCSMVEVFRNLVNVMNVPVGEAVAMLAENPAR